MGELDLNATGDRLADPKLPGYVAMSATNMSGVFVDERRRRFFTPFHAMTPVASIGYSINVYWVEKRWY